jgi:uncharacterized protein (DUF1499 family)
LNSFWRLAVLTDTDALFYINLTISRDRRKRLEILSYKERGRQGKGQKAKGQGQKAREGGFLDKMGFEWLLGFFLVAFLFGGCSGTGPPNLGVKDKRLSSCPASPNCVSSQSDDQRHKTDPIRFSAGSAEALARLKMIVLGMERSFLVRESPDYLHVEFRTFLGFVDDVEFHADEGEKVIHLRSASRVGYWDLGVNRRRIEAIRTEFAKKYEGIDEGAALQPSALQKFSCCLRAFPQWGPK